MRYRPSRRCPVTGSATVVPPARARVSISTSTLHTPRRGSDRVRPSYGSARSHPVHRAPARRTGGGACQSVLMTSLADADQSQLVDEWLDWSETARSHGVTEAKVRSMIKAHELAGAGP